jgi:hypothetical protein
VWMVSRKSGTMRNDETSDVMPSRGIGAWGEPARDARPRPRTRCSQLRIRFSGAVLAHERELARRLVERVAQRARRLPALKHRFVKDRYTVACHASARWPLSRV